MGDIAQPLMDHPGSKGIQPSVSGISVMSGVGVMVGAAAYSPLMLYAVWGGQMSRGYRLALVVVSIVATLTVLSLLIARRTGSRARVFAGVGICWLVISIGGNLADRLPLGRVPSALVVLGLAGLAGWLIYRLGEWRVLAPLATVLAVVLIGSPAVEIGAMLLSGGQPMVPVRDSDTLSAPAVDEPSGPDVWFIVLDAYPASSVLADTYGFSGGHLGKSLAGLGFDVNPDALSPYGSTLLSMPSLMDGEYIAGGAAAIGPSDLRGIRLRVSGRNEFMDALRSLGYRLTVVENGWRFVGCDEGVQTCVPAPIFGEAMGYLTNRSVFGRLTGFDQDYAFVRGAEASLDWMRHHAALVDANGVPDVVFLHVLAPHPPLFLGADCSRPELDGSRRGLALASHGTDDETRANRRRLFVDQVICISQTVVQLVESLRDDTIVAIVGDHGPDSFGQLEVDPKEWTSEMTRERLLTLAAVRLPDSCPADLISTMGVLLAVENCLTGSDRALPPLKAFGVGLEAGSIFTVVPVEGERLEHLLDIAGSYTATE
ncbi:hypothetical protein BH23ACT5_BH23ACT5_24390 [soil metagenome]